MGWTFARTPFLIAGPCVIEPGDVLPRVAATLAQLGASRGLQVCFKASFDKANRARGDAPRGPGLEEGLRMLERVRAECGLPILTDIHESAQAAATAEVADVLQIPAFLCRQTDLLVAAGRTGRPVNVKKGQWVQAETMAGALDKVRSGGSSDVAVTERGTFFGYGDLVVDMRNFTRLRAATGAPVIFDATANRRRHRDLARQQIPRFVEVYVDCPLETCMARDPKGIYRRARSPSAAAVPGLQAPYEPPENAEITILCNQETSESAAARVIAKLAEKGYLWNERRSGLLSRVDP